MNKAIILGALSCLLATAAIAKGGHSGSSYGTGSSSSSHSVSGHVRSNGTYVAPSHATNPNGTKSDNYSTKGNINPYTGKEGTK
ncbi:hypothetical protein [Variovorax soli]|uniref:Uncharacterized protein n=1 Tax=Variovorax soli TaxID=376815 RepID=A0ABU1NEZ1_9BURK|nr:hypothetical protein [Variovorax soli]MDR6536976.1 hypothetical protein [Variovorax soli]